MSQATFKIFSLYKSQFLIYLIFIHVLQQQQKSFTCLLLENIYDAVPVWVQDLVPKSDESESGQMVSEKVKWA